MARMLKSSAIFGLLALTTLAGCAGVDPQANPSEFEFWSDGEDIDGTYNPAGFSAGEVKQEIAQTCRDDQLLDASYREVVMPNGLASFTADCAFADVELVTIATSHHVRK